MFLGFLIPITVQRRYIAIIIFNIAASWLLPLFTSIRVESDIWLQFVLLTMALQILCVQQGLILGRGARNGRIALELTRFCALVGGCWWWWAHDVIDLLYGYFWWAALDWIVDGWCGIWHFLSHFVQIATQAITEIINNKQTKNNNESYMNMQW